MAGVIREAAASRGAYFQRRCPARAPRPPMVD